MFPDMISVIIPAYNEADRLPQSLTLVVTYLLRQPKLASEVIVVDDGSSDDVTTIAKKVFSSHAGDISGRVIRHTVNRGKGHAVRQGLLAAVGNIAIFCDADLSTPISELPKLVNPIVRNELDVAVGSRALDRSLIGVLPPWGRERSGRLFNVFVRMSTRLPFLDTQCGFKAFRMCVCRPIIESASIDRFGFDVELLYVAHRAGLRIKEIPVRWDHHHDGSKVNIWRDSRRMFHEVKVVRRQAQAGFYDMAIKATQEAVRLDQRMSSAYRVDAKAWTK